MSHEVVDDADPIEGVPEWLARRPGVAYRLRHSSGDPVHTRPPRIAPSVEDDRGVPLQLGDRVRFGPFQLTVVGLPERGEFAADVPPGRRRGRGPGLLARAADGELFHFDAPALHLHRVATRTVALAS